MKKDINFLQVKKQGDDKKGANTVVILSIVLVLIVGLVAFMFGSTKSKINAVNQHISQLEIETTTSKFAKRDAEYNKVSAKLNEFLLDTIKIPSLRNNVDALKDLSYDLFTSIDSAKQNDFGDVKINISRFQFDAGTGVIELNCNVVKDLDPNVETLRQVDYFIDRLSDRSDLIKSATASSVGLSSSTGEVIFNATIIVNDEMTPKGE